MSKAQVVMGIFVRVASIVALSGLTGPCRAATTVQEDNTVRTAITAQEDTTTSEVSGPAPPIPLAAGRAPNGRSLVLAPGDQIAITVREHPDYTLSETVRPDGKIGYVDPLPDVQVAGKTADQVRDTISRGLSRYIRNPDVTVLVLAYHVENIYVVGSVRAFGPFTFVPGMTAQEALHLAGGADPDADLQHITVIRDHKTAADLDLSQGDGAPFPLNPSDMVLVTRRAMQSVTVVGQVQHPGAQPLLPNEHLLDALTQAGAVDGPTGGSGPGLVSDADWANSTLTRGKVVQKVDVEAILQGAMDQNVLLEPGDVIYVPQAARITVVGAVQRPGSQSLSPHEHVLDAVTAAGVTPVEGATLVANTSPSGSAPIPDLSHTTLTRAGKVQTIDMTAILRGSQPDNIRLEPDDVIFIPELRGVVTVLGEVQHPQTAALLPGARVLDLVNLAGGLTPAANAPKAALRHLSGQTTSVDLDALLHGKDSSQNLPLQDGDVLTVPVNNLQIAVLGQVAHPGFYNFKPGDGVFSAVVLAGGTSGPANLKNVNLVRYDQGTTPVHYSVNVQEMRDKGNFRTDRPLQPGDVVYVAATGQSPSALATILPALSAITSLKYLLP